MQELKTSSDEMIRHVRKLAGAPDHKAGDEQKGDGASSVVDALAEHQQKMKDRNKELNQKNQKAQKRMFDQITRIETMLTNAQKK